MGEMVQASLERESEVSLTHLEPMDATASAAVAADGSTPMEATVVTAVLAPAVGATLLLELQEKEATAVAAVAVATAT